MPWKQWEELSKRAKTVQILLASTAGIVGMVLAGYFHFTTDAEAAEEHEKLKEEHVEILKEAGKEDKRIEHEFHKFQQQLVVSNNRSEIWRAKREINRLQDELAIDDLSDTRRARLENDIAEYQQLINCIQEGKELCY